LPIGLTATLGLKNAGWAHITNSPASMDNLLAKRVRGMDSRGSLHRTISIVPDATRKVNRIRLEKQVITKNEQFLNLSLMRKPGSTMT
jgi:hypothetical protein